MGVFHFNKLSLRRISFSWPPNLIFYQSRFEVTLRLTVNQWVCPGIEHPCGTCDQIFLPVTSLLSEICGLVSVGRPLWREEGSAICSVMAQWSKSRRNRNHTLLSQLRLLPTWRVRFPYLHPPGTGWPRYTPRHWVQQHIKFNEMTNKLTPCSWVVSWLAILKFSTYLWIPEGSKTYRSFICIFYWSYNFSLHKWKYIFYDPTEQTNKKKEADKHKHKETIKITKENSTGKTQM
jgi:hypothetical protein